MYESEKDFQRTLIKSQNIFCSPDSFKGKLNIKSINRNMPIRIYNSGQNGNFFTRKLSVNSEAEINSNKNNQFSPIQPSINKKLFPNQNVSISYSDLQTTASFSSQKSSESFISPMNNISPFSQNNFALMNTKNNIRNPSNLVVTNNSFNNYCLLCNNSGINNSINNFNNINNFSPNDLTNIIKINPIINRSFSYNNISHLNVQNENIFYENKRNFNLKPLYNMNNINLMNNINISNNDIFDTQKSINFSELNILNNKDLVSIESINQSNLNSMNVSNKNSNQENQNKKKNKLFYNKFSSPKENFMNENTVILTLKIKVAKNDYRYFNLKKYDDLFVSLEKFVDLNKIKQELVKPIVTKIFLALNKIFWLLNNKIGKYDRKYLTSLYKLWIKNKQNFPQNYYRYKANSDKSTASSSDSSDENSFENIKSNSFQNTDGNSSDEKEKKNVKTI